MKWPLVNRKKYELEKFLRKESDLFLDHRKELYKELQYKFERLERNLPALLCDRDENRKLKEENEVLRKQAVRYYMKSFPQRMRDAVNDCVNNNLSLRKSAKKHEVKKTTLWNRINYLNKMKEGE